MSRSPLRPLPLASSAFMAVRRKPFCLLPLAAVALIILASSQAAPSASGRSMLVLVSFVLTWLAGYLTLQSLACSYFEQGGGEKIPASAILKAGRLGALGALASLFWLGLLLFTGALAMIVGALFGFALALWALCVRVLSNDKGKESVDRAWSMAGLSGLLWVLLSSAAGVFMASFLVIAASAAFGPSAAALYPPLAAMLALPLTFAAVIQRR